MRLFTVLPLAAASLLVLPSADAQRRTSNDPVGGTDLQLLASGLDVNGAGLRFWIAPQTALALRATVDYDRLNVDGDDPSTLGLGFGLNLENHAYRRARVHPYLSAGVSVDHVSQDNGGGGDASQTTFGGEVALGAEARLMQGLTLSGQYGVGLGYTTGDLPAGGDSRVSIGLGGTPRMALSLRF